MMRVSSNYFPLCRKKVQEAQSSGPHEPILALADKLLVLKSGSIAAFGGRDEVLKSINQASAKITKLPHTASPRT